MRLDKSYPRKWPFMGLWPLQRAEGGAAEGRTSAPPVARPAGPPASDLRPCARTPPPTLCPDLSLRARPKLWLPVPPSASPVSVQLPTGCGHVGTGSGLGLGTSRPNVGATGSRLRTTGGQLQDRISGRPGQRLQPGSLKPVGRARRGHVAGPRRARGTGGCLFAHARPMTSRFGEVNSA